MKNNPQRDVFCDAIRGEIDRLEMQIDYLQHNQYDDYSPDITTRREQIERLRNELRIAKGWNGTTT